MDPQQDMQEATARQRVRVGLAVVASSLPHLSGLAVAVRPAPDRRVDVAAVTASGRLMFNPGVFALLTVEAAAFVLAHELLHLALRTHERAGKFPHRTVNLAHDALINDVLLHETDWRPDPLGGVFWPGARSMSLEELCLLAARHDDGLPRPGFSSTRATDTLPPSPETTMERALRDAGILAEAPTGGHLDSTVRDPRDVLEEEGDAITLERERALFPEHDAHAQQVQERAIDREIAKATALRAVLDLERSSAHGTETGDQTAEVAALRGLYQAPWQLVVQRWLDALGPATRSWSRPSRRAGTRSDVILPGRRRDGWTVHIVLDTSGSMIRYLPHALGAVGSLLEAAAVDSVHIVQADTEITEDHWVAPEDLDTYQVRGLGGTDLYPALAHIATDQTAEAVLVITDGYFDVEEFTAPRRRWMDLRRLWLVIDNPDFEHHDDPVAHIDTAGSLPE